MGWMHPDDLHTAKLGQIKAKRRREPPTHEDLASLSIRDVRPSGSGSEVRRKLLFRQKQDTIQHAELVKHIVATFHFQISKIRYFLT